MAEREYPAGFKVSIELEAEKKLSGDDLFALLDHIDTSGSISQATSRLGASYRYSWGLIKKAEKALGLKLVEKQAGGPAGGGTFLTREGRDLLMQYRAFCGEIRDQMMRYLPVTGTPGNAAVPRESQELEKQPQKAGKDLEPQLILASTMEPVETGLLDILEQAFYHRSGILVRHIAAGSGRALEIARGGRVDMVLSHAPKLENQFMQEGWGALKIYVMSNPFVVVGPGADPAGIKAFVSTDGLVKAFQKIAAKHALFVSRGDRSGTHLREMEIWKSSGVKPGGDWYLKSTGLVGNLGILRLAQEKQAYTLVDRASYILSRSSLKIFFQSDAKEPRPELTNLFALTLVNPDRFSTVCFSEALVFAQWLQGLEAREMIQNFGMENFGTALFSADV